MSHVTHPHLLQLQAPSRVRRQLPPRYGRTHQSWLRSRRWLDTTLMGGLGRILAALPQPRPLYPRRDPAYFEAARMSRAMDRL